MTTWILSEIILNLLGLDNLADYSEFIFDQEFVMSTRHHPVIVLVPPQPPQDNQGLPYPYTISDRT
ncbi:MULTISPECIES: hypothetical protein [unclassified Coleofasciculus]|uniref:hypothetical protein n=1 Tax=unclassified Coleofasciculus TaxID=2692782 RepID=UPI002AD25DEB|nr:MULTISPECIES: hypothetical protein [unclassified Coleofasciculus]